MRPGDDGGGRKGAVHVGKNGARQEGIAGEEREAGKNQIASGDKVLIEAQEKVRKGLFERFDHIREAFLVSTQSTRLRKCPLISSPAVSAKASS